MIHSRVSSWAIRKVPIGILSWLHGFRFAWLRRRLRQDPETLLVPGLLSEGDVAVDVGANGANWTWYLSKAAGPTGRVLAFEADPYYSRATARAIRIMRLRNVTLLPIGLSDHTETVTLRILGRDGRRLAGCSHVDKGSAPGGSTMPVDLVPLDGLRGDHPELDRTRLIKCDTEGYELFVLKGAERILGIARPALIFELGDFEGQGYGQEDLAAWLHAHGYELFVLRRDHQLVRLRDRLDHEDAATVNRVGLPAERLGGYSHRLPFAEQP